MNDRPLPDYLLRALDKRGFERPTETLRKNELRSTLIGMAIAVPVMAMVFGLPLVVIGFTWTSGTNACGSDTGVDCHFALWSATSVAANVVQGILLSLAGLFLLGSILAIVGAVLEPYRYVCVYPWGLFQSADLELPWERIDTVLRGWRTGGGEDPLEVGLDTIQLRRDDGRKLDLDRSWRRDNDQGRRMALCELVEREFVTRRLPAELARYDSGEQVSYGDLELSTRGPTHAGESLPWSEVESFEAGEDVVRIKKRGKTLDWYNRPVPEIPNACLLRALCHARELTVR